MKVKRNTLLLLACLVWSAAGFNILRIGLLAYPGYVTVVNCLLSVLVFFYTGLGASLLLAGLLFGHNYYKAVFTAAVQNKRSRKEESL